MSDELSVRLPDGSVIPLATFEKQRLTREQRKAGMRGMPNRQQRRELRHAARRKSDAAPKQVDGLTPLRSSGPSSKAKARLRRRSGQT